MSNSKLVDYTRLSPNYNPRQDKIRKITIHHMAGNLSVETCGSVFAPTSRQASSNYGIGSDGRVGLYVEEHNRAWTSSSAENDHQAITIEVANDGGAPNWHVSDKALNKTIDLCVDICKRNGIAKLNYTGDASGNLTKHEYFANTNCPGPYLGSKFTYIAQEVNKRLGAAESQNNKDNPNRSTGALFTCTGLWTQANGGTWYPASKLLYGKGDYTIGKVYKGAQHPYEALHNGQVIGFANDKCIDDEPSLPGKNASSTVPNKKTNSQIADEVIAGKWGNGDERKQRLKKAGYDYDAIQKIVNEKSLKKKTNKEIAQEVIAGLWGNGDERKQRLKKAGYDYNTIQNIVNTII